MFQGKTEGVFLLRSIVIWFIFTFRRGKHWALRFWVYTNWVFFHFTWFLLVVIQWGCFSGWFQSSCFSWVSRLNRAWQSKFFCRFSIFQSPTQEPGCPTSGYWPVFCVFRFIGKAWGFPCALCWVPVCAGARESRLHGAVIAGDPSQPWANWPAPTKRTFTCDIVPEGAYIQVQLKSFLIFGSCISVPLWLIWRCFIRLSCRCCFSMSKLNGLSYCCSLAFCLGL